MTKLLSQPPARDGAGALGRKRKGAPAPRDGIRVTGFRYAEGGRDAADRYQGVMGAFRMLVLDITSEKIALVPGTPISIAKPLSF